MIRFQVDIEIYPGKLDQLGDRILFSHIIRVINSWKFWCIFFSKHSSEPRNHKTSKLLLLWWWCFTALRHISGHFGRGQVTYPQCPWVSLLVHILSPVTDNCPSWISGGERMAQNWWEQGAKIGQITSGPFYSNFYKPVHNGGPVAEWLRPLIFITLNHSSSHRCRFEPSSGHMWDKPSSACVGSGGFSRQSSVFAPP